MQTIARVPPSARHISSNMSPNVRVTSVRIQARHRQHTQVHVMVGGHVDEHAIEGRQSIHVKVVAEWRIIPLGEGRIRHSSRSRIACGAGRLRGWIRLKEAQPMAAWKVLRQQLDQQRPPSYQMRPARAKQSERRVEAAA